MGAYCSAIWRCRYFWLSLVKMDLRARYRGSVLGMGWSLLQPLAMTAIFCIVFCKLFHEDPRTYAPFVLTGLAFWSYFVTAVVGGCGSFFQGETYIRQFPAPMAIYPLRTVLGAAFHLALALLVALALSIVATGNFSILAILSLIPALLLLVLFGWAVAILAGLATVYFRDTKHLTEMGLQVVFYMTPIMYRPQLLERNGLGWLVEFNPLMPLLALVRTPIVEGHVPGLRMYLEASLLVLITLGFAAWLLRRLEGRLIFHL